ncbi:sunset domain-containing protein [Gordoniibacillus kamchatkensis]|uniref:sunset domain-containing protein n=1 Tax=Gordoniibacillus kamchatkensis TaxID=1590651 RepID=UPI0012E05812|nr:hypothetical protein [Paenibacillus sp. VKM B-2647]
MRLFILGIFLALSACGLSKNAVASDHGGCPADHPIKGNVNQVSGEKIYHLPGDPYYRRTNAEECFANAEDARNAGYRASKR